jgi:glycerol-3-phosphate dehydrogenase
VVLDHPELVKATRNEMMYFVNRDGRICTFYSVCGKVIAGTTDIPTQDSEAICDETEVDYILDGMRLAFPSIRVDRSHVVFRFSGVRPLPRSDALTPGQISRDHSYPVLEPGNGIEFPIYSLVGGKWTTYRALAEQVGDEILKVLGHRRIRDSANLPIGGGKGFPLTSDEAATWHARMRERTGLSAERLMMLLDRYGAWAEKVAGYLQLGPDEPLACHSDYSRREIEFIVREERVVHLDDLILRRTLMGLLGQVCRPLLEELAMLAAPVLRWSRDDAAGEVDRTAQLLEKAHGMMLAPRSKSPSRCSQTCRNTACSETRLGN